MMTRCRTAAARAAGVGFLAALAVAASAFGQPAVQPARPAHPDAAAVHAALDTLLARLHRRGWFDGALVAGRGDTVLYARGFGYANRAAGVRFTPRTTADGGSLAKTFTAAVLLMLQEEGRLALNDPVQQHLPAYPYPGTTLGHLITHRLGGTPDYDYFWARIGAEEPLTNARLLDVLGAYRPALRFPPGERFTYDDRGFDLAALVIARVAGRSYEDVLRARILEPLGMDSLFARPARFADWPGLRTLSYRREGDSLVVFDVWDREGFHGGSNLYFSADDLYRWVTSFYTRPVLGPAALAAGLSAVQLRDGRTTGINLLSWYPDDARRRFQYPGVLQGFHSVGYWDAGRGLSFALVSNTNMPQRLRPLVAAAIAEILATGRPVDLALPERGPLGEGFDAVVGTYALTGRGAARLTVEDSLLTVRVDDGPAYRVFRVDAATLYVPGLDAWLTFDAPAHGRFRRLHWSTVFHPTHGMRTE